MNKIDKIYLDMDGVLADFDGHFRNLFGLDPSIFETMEGSVAFWELIYEKPNFFRDLPAFEHLMQVIHLSEQVTNRVVILSSPSRINTPLCMIQKREWIDKHLGKHFPAIFISDKEKYAGPRKILVDDTPKKIDRWVKAGGIGHLFTTVDKYYEFLEEK